MKPFVLYEPTTGEITRWGESPDLTVHHESGSLIEGQGEPATHYVHRGELTAYTDAQAAAKAARPAARAEWSNTLMRWVDVRSLEEAQADKWNAIKARRLIESELPVSTSAGLFDADAESRAKLDEVIARLERSVALGRPDAASYTLATNVRVTLTLAQLHTAALALGDQLQHAHDIAGALRERIYSQTTVPGVVAITWPVA